MIIIILIFIINRSYKLEYNYGPHKLILCIKVKSNLQWLKYIKMLLTINEED